MLVHRWDAPTDDTEWATFLAAQGFGHLVASGRDRDVPIVVPTQFVVDHDEVLIHLARPNPIWAAIDENRMVVLSVAGDWAYIPAAWKAIADEDPRYGIPTTYYGAVQVTGPAEIIDQPDAVADLLRRQLDHLEPDSDRVDPLEHGSRLGQIRGLRLLPTEVRAKFKYGGNVDQDHRHAIADRLAERASPSDVAARVHLLRRLSDRPTP
jgi:transcriptional regulator